jgi:hypothetical protein
MDTPIGAEPPVKGPSTPILMGSAAIEDAAQVTNAAATTDFSALFISVSYQLNLFKVGCFLSGKLFGLPFLFGRLVVLPLFSVQIFCCKK